MIPSNNNTSFEQKVFFTSTVAVAILDRAGAGVGAELGTGGRTVTLLLPLVLQLAENLSGSLATSPRGDTGDTVPFQLLAPAAGGPGAPRVGKSARPRFGTVLEIGGSARGLCFTYNWKFQDY